MLVITSLIALCTLVGCGASQTGAVNQNAFAIQGNLHAGKQRVANAVVQLYAVGTSGNGSSATPLGLQTAMTDAQGNFVLTGFNGCASPTAQVYLIARGGNSGLTSGAANSAIAEMAFLGLCNKLTNSTPIVMNETTTIASIWPLAEYMQSATQLGWDPAEQSPFEAAAEVVGGFIEMGTGSPSGDALPAGANALTEKLHSLANIIAACIDTEGGTAGDGSACGNLFLNATVGNGPAPTDTVAAAIAIAQNPTKNVAVLFNSVPGQAPFQPALTSAPTDWTLVLTTPLIAPIQYVAPLSMDASKTVQSIAALNAGASSAASMTISVAAATRVTMAPGSVTLGPDGKQQFTAAMAGGGTPGIAWTLSPAIGTVSASGLYTAPTSMSGSQTVLLTATNIDDSTKHATAYVALDSSIGSGEVAHTNLRFIDSVGINTHLTYQDTYTDPAFTKAELLKLGIKHVRDSIDLGQLTSAYAPQRAAALALGAAGVKFELGPNAPPAPYIPNYSSTLLQAATKNLMVNGSTIVEAFEGLNELDVNAGANWTATWVSNWKALKAADTVGIALFGPPLAYFNNASSLPVQTESSSMEVFGNFHPYPGNSNPGVVFPTELDAVKAQWPSVRIVATESGYYDASASGPGYVDDATQAKYIPRILTENFLQGMYRTYIYELQDEVSSWNTFLQEKNGPHTCVQCSYGMITSTYDPVSPNTEKPSFRALQNLITILNAGATSASPGALTYSIRGGNANLHHVLLQKSPGVFDLILWQEISGWDGKAPIANAALPVTLTVNATSVRTYLPSASAISTPTSLSGHTLSLSVPDEVIIVEITL